MKFRKKPVVIDATNWDGSVEDATRVIDWVLEGDGTARYIDYPDGEPKYVAIDTLEGTMLASPGDWIIRGVQGEFYPCRDDIFGATYEPVES